MRDFPAMPCSKRTRSDASWARSVVGVDEVLAELAVEREQAGDRVGRGVREVVDRAPWRCTTRAASW